MKKMLTLTSAALIGLSVAGTAPALAGGFGHGFGHGHGFGFGFGHKVKVCYFNAFHSGVICKWRRFGY